MNSAYKALPEPNLNKVLFFCLMLSQEMANLVPILRNRDYDVILGVNVTLGLPLKESLNYFIEEAIPGHNDYG
jgi:hypothetical protein